jgi:hypothetical protein
VFREEIVVPLTYNDPNQGENFINGTVRFPLVPFSSFHPSSVFLGIQKLTDEHRAQSTSTASTPTRSASTARTLTCGTPSSQPTTHTTRA